jgi:hypothetical protein
MKCSPKNTHLTIKFIIIYHCYIFLNNVIKHLLIISHKIIVMLNDSNITLVFVDTMQ